MPAHRRIGPAGIAGALGQQLLVKRLAHAVQALELEILGIGSHFGHGGDGQRIVGGELRDDARTQGQQLPGAGLVVEVGHRLAREHRIIGEAALLGALQLRIPIGALDEAHHHAAAMALGERGDVVDDGRGALLIGLDRQAKAVPIGQGGVGEDGVDHIEREFEPVGLLGVDGEVEVIALGLAGQLDHLRRQFGQHRSWFVAS